MGEVEIMERDDRGSALDAFARSGEGPSPGTGMTIPNAAFGAPAERVFGAQAVAVHRDEAKVLQKLRALAAAAGDDWYYRFPVQNRKENRTDYIEGASIKLANDLARMYGNCEIETRVMDLGDSWLIYARFTDYETGFALTRPFQQRKSGSKMGGADEARRLDIAFQIGVSKAIRNVVTNALQTFADFAFQEAKNALVDKIGKRLPEYRARTVEKLEPKLEIKRVEAVIGRVAGEWLAPDIARIIAMMKAVEDGMASLDETFPPLGQAKAAEAGAGGPSEQQQPGAGLDGFAAAGGQGKNDAGREPAGQPASEEAGHPEDHAAGHQPAASADSPAASTPVEIDPESPRGKVIAALRKGAAKGARGLRLARGKLTEEEEALLSDEEWKEIEAEAAQAGAVQS
jgi:hypothetical protein